MKIRHSFAAALDVASACAAARLVSWEPPAEPLVPPHVVDEIREAVGLLAPPGTSGHAARLRAALCSLPRIEAFDNLLTDAWSALRGDLDAAARLQDVLQALCAEDACDSGSGRNVARAQRGVPCLTWEQHPSTGLNRMRRWGARSCAQDAPQWLSRP